MDQHKNRVIPTLIAVAASSVVTFSGIGVAAITGHLPIAQSSLNPFSALISQSRSFVVSNAHLGATHQGLTRSAGETPAQGKPVDFRPGKRVPSHKATCANCGVVDAIRAKERKREGLEETASGITFVDRQAESEAAQLTSFVVTLRMEDGTVRTIHENQPPPFSIGERVKLVNGAVIPLG